MPTPGAGGGDRADRHAGRRGRLGRDPAARPLLLPGRSRARPTSRSPRRERRCSAASRALARSTAKPPCSSATPSSGMAPSAWCCTASRSCRASRRELPRSGPSWRSRPWRAMSSASWTGGPRSRHCARPSRRCARTSATSSPAASCSASRSTARTPPAGEHDYLVRGIIGADPDAGTVTVGAPVTEGQVVRLHARDADSADHDLRSALELRRSALGGDPAGALVFTCNGRGRGMFGTPDHDADAVDEELGGAPSAGFFAAGEIGPVGGENFLHGFTATVAVFAGRLTPGCAGCETAAHDHRGTGCAPHGRDGRHRTGDRAAAASRRRGPRAERAASGGARAARSRAGRRDARARGGSRRPRRRRAARRRVRGRRRPRGQRRAARVGPAAGPHPGGDRPRAGGEPARADHARAPARRAGWPSAAPAISCSSPRSPGRPRRPGSSIYSATKYGLRGFGRGLRADLAPHGRGRERRLPRLHPRRGHVPRLGRELPSYVGTSTPGGRRATACVAAIEKRSRRGGRRADRRCAPGREVRRAGAQPLRSRHRAPRRRATSQTGWRAARPTSARRAPARRATSRPSGSGSSRR